MADEARCAARFEYKFVRTAPYEPKAKWSLRVNPSSEYQDVIAEHAALGWRLVQVFAPPIVGYGSAKFFEIILERELPGGTK
mgnify:CR=1 FL=1